MKINIRKAETADAFAIRALIQGVAHTFLAETSGLNAEAFFKTITAEALGALIADTSFIYLVAVAGEELAGVLAIQHNRHVYHLFVAESFQQRGVARRLWERGESMALEAGNPGWFSLNSTPNAVAVYEHLGFRSTGQRLRKYGIDFVPMMLKVERSGGTD